MKKKKIVFTGGTGRFAIVFKNLNSIKKYFKKVKPGYLIHTAALSRPMNIHEKNITKSINTNIIGTANIVNACQKDNIKLIYFSTNYVYPGKKGNYKETDPVLPINKYAISKFGGECSVQMYENSLILRICMTEKPFIHKKAFSDVEMNFMFHESLAKNLLKLIDKKGIINVGGKKQLVINFAKKYNKKIERILAKEIYGKSFPLKPSMNVNLYNKLIK